MNVVLHDRASVTYYRTQLWQEHLGVVMQTREIRDFFTKWNATSLPVVNRAEDCDPAQVHTVHAVKFGNPPAGQEYNGPGSWLPFFSMDDQV